MKGAGEMVGGERESMCTRESKRGAEREGEREKEYHEECFVVPSTLITHSLQS